MTNEGGRAAASGIVVEPSYTVASQICPSSKALAAATTAASSKETYVMPVVR